MFNIKLKEPTFRAIRFNGFDPMVFVREFKDTGLAGSFYFNIKLEWNPTIEFWHKDDKEVDVYKRLYKIEHDDYLIISEESVFSICNNNIFNKTYKIMV